MLTDMYQISMTYAHWKNKKVDQPAVFDLFFRKNPFHGEYCIFAGQDEVIRLLSSFKFHPDDVKYLQTIMPTAEPEFFSWLLTLDCSGIKVYSMEEGSVSSFFPLIYLCVSSFSKIYSIAQQVEINLAINSSSEWSSEDYFEGKNAWYTSWEQIKTKLQKYNFGSWRMYDEMQMIVYYHCRPFYVSPFVSRLMHNSRTWTLAVYFYRRYAFQDNH